MEREQLYNLIVDLIPQYFECENGYGLHRTKINIGGVPYYFKSFRRNSQNMSKLVRLLNQFANRFLEIKLGSHTIERELIESYIVTNWLKIRGYDKVKWLKLFDYFKSLEHVTHENENIGVNFILNQNLVGEFNMIDLTEEKLLNVMGGSTMTYFRLGRDWTYIDYNYIKWEDIGSEKENALIPGFLHPYYSILEDGECGIIRTKREDIIIFDKSGLLASKRMGNWKIYEADTLKNTYVDILTKSIVSPQYWMGCNLFHIVFDLSYKRHGGLIIVDLDDNCSLCVSNEESFIKSDNFFKNILRKRLEKIDLTQKDVKNVFKPLILELASIDGALIFNKKGKVKAFGAMVKPHEHVKYEKGARSTAALSAIYYGMIAIKVSEDGEIIIFFKKNGEIIKLSFL